MLNPFPTHFRPVYSSTWFPSFSNMTILLRRVVWKQVTTHTSRLEPLGNAGVDDPAHLPHPPTGGIQLPCKGHHYSRGKAGWIERLVGVVCNKMRCLLTMG